MNELVPTFEGLILREFEQSDRQMVSDFFDAMGGESRAFFDRGGSNKKNGLKKWDGDNSSKVDFAAILDGQMVGYLFLFDMNTGVPWLGIGIADEFKGMKLGRILMNHAENYCRSLGKGGILLMTHVANLRGQGLYVRMGYEHIGKHETGEELYILRF